MIGSIAAYAGLNLLVYQRRRSANLVTAPLVVMDNMPGKIRDYCEKTGQPVPESPGQILRVATESLALKYRYVYGNICHLTGRTYSRLHAGGGGIQNQMLCQATANARGDLGWD